MKKRLVPDWMFKAFLVLAAWLLTFTLLVRLVTSLATGRVERLGGRVYYLSDSPTAFTTHIGFLLIGTICVSLMALLSLGFVPAIGRRYKTMLLRRLQKLETRRDRH